MTSISYISESTSIKSPNGAEEGKDGKENEALSEEKELFLNILLTQLENQNPLDPVDTTEFTNQLVAYSSLEQEMTTNQNLDKIISNMDESSALSAFSYVGMDVEIDSNATLMQDDVAEWTYVLADDAKDVTVQIANSEGKIIASYSIDVGDAGTYSFSIKNSDLTEEVDENTPLFLGVIATDSEGEKIKTDVTAIVTVGSVETSGSEVTLKAGKMSFSTDDVLSLRQNGSGNA